MQVCSFGALRLVVNCLTLMMLKSNFLEIYFAGVSGGKRRITAFIGFSKFGEKAKY
jgi:hypothetical protein